MKVKRYFPDTAWTLAGPLGVMIESEYGEWVKHSAYQRLLNELKRLKGRSK